MATLPLPTGFDAKISQAIAGSYTQRRREIKFGDGYAQHQRDGLNTAEASYAIEWQSLTVAEATTLITFFESQAGVDRITWTPPLRSAAQLFTCVSFAAKLSKDSGTRWTVTATFERVFG